MNDRTRERIQVFDRAQEYAVVERRLPHWTQAGTICFITWRTWDSIPAPVLEKWLGERDTWLARHGIDPQRADWNDRLQSLDKRLVAEFREYIADRWNGHLDECRGSCVLRRPELSKIVSDSLLHFDGDRYDLTDFIVMPNHVHVLCAFPEESAMLSQCESWKHFTATKINRALGRRGRFWQQDGFDHLVRSPDEFSHFRCYIADNPRFARLQAEDFVHWSKKL
jgi:type I restriction enzyme R subunit